MTSIFEWATGAIAAVRDSVAAPFASNAAAISSQSNQGPTAPSSKLPDFKSKSAKTKKNAKRNPPKRQQNKCVPDHPGSDEEPIRSGSEQQNTCVVENPASDEEPVRSESEQQNKSVAERLGSDEEPLNSADDDAVKAEAEQRRKEKAARKRQHEKDRREQRKIALQNSLVKELPECPLEPERQAIYNELKGRFDALAPFTGKSLDEVLSKFTETQRELDGIVESIDVKIRHINRKTPKLQSTARGLSVQEVRKSIQDMEISGTHDNPTLLRRVEELRDLVSQEKTRAFLVKMNEMRDAIESRRRQNIHDLDAARVRDTKQRAVERYVNLYGEEKANQLTNSQLDLSHEMQACLYQPAMCSRKLERKFKVLIDAAPGARPPGRNTSPRSIIIWGQPDAVSGCMDWLEVADLSGKHRREFETGLMKAIIGKAGTRLAKLEQDHDCLIHCDLTTVTLYGASEKLSQVWEEIGTLDKEAVQENRAVEQFDLDSTIGRAIVSLHVPLLHTLEVQHDVRITVLTKPTEGNPRILIRGAEKNVNKSKSEIKKELVDRFRALTFISTSRAISRLLVPPRNANQQNQARICHEEFKVFREALQLFVDRHDPTKESEEGILTIVCLAKDTESVQNRVQDLLARANYKQEKIPIQREQLRIFTPENRALIEATSGCRFGVQPGDTGTSLILNGSNEAIEEGKKIVAEILDREGIVHAYTFKNPELIGLLLRDRASEIRAIQEESCTSISIFRETNSAKIVGDQSSIDAAVKILDARTQELEERAANTSTLILEIDADRIPQLIGRGGSNISEIRAIPGLATIDIPKRSDCAVVSVTVTGTEEALETAQKLIEETINSASRRTAPAGNGREGNAAGGEASRESAPRGRGRGRGRPPQTEQAPASMIAPPQSSMPGVVADDQDEFPTIEFSHRH